MNDTLGHAAGDAVIAATGTGSAPGQTAERPSDGSAATSSP
ncbi:hypothetical protein [Streptomyces atroolivaceus]